MVERPILFSGEMVRAILDGRKTQTRRVVTHRRYWCMEERDDGSPWPFFDPYVYAEPEAIEVPCPYGEPGDLLYVRETHAIVPASAYRCSREDDGSPVPHRVSPEGVPWVNCWAIYREGWTRSQPSHWRPSIHMPRWASRITLRVTGVRVERVQDISTDDAFWEGVEDCHEDGHDDCFYGTAGPRCSFRRLWDHINGPRRYGWDANPWVWVVEFERVEAPC